MTLSHASKNRLALTAICLAALMFGLEISSVPVILPTLERVLHSDFSDMQWIMNAYTLACTAVMMATGTLSDRFGRRRVFIIAIAAFGLTSLLCGLANGSTMLIAGRFMQGMAGGAMLICQVAALSHQFQSGKQRGQAFGIWGVVFGIGLGFGPAIGGAIVALANWQWVFLIHVIIAVLTLLLVIFSVQESRDPQAAKLDSLGIVTLSLSVFGLVYFITQGAGFGFVNVRAGGILLAAALSLLLFIGVERRTPYPMIAFSVFRNRQFSGALMGSIGMNFSFWPFMIYLPLYFQIGLGYDSLTTGLSLLAYTLPTLVFPPLGERLALRYRPGAVIPAGLFALGLGFLLMKSGSSGEHAGGWAMLPGLLLAGIGLGITNTPVTNTTTGSVSNARAGMASGIDMSARMIALAINIAVMGFILLAGVDACLRQTLPESFATLPPGSVAEQIVAGNLSALKARPEWDALAPLVHAALTHSFGLVMLYGGLGAWALAAASLAIFAPWKTAAALPR
ncbi:MFS transporter [Serratia plymuthica]|uniref:MFS transporter n=1 Tax=Serratia plymuthica TaxID=82996 RepID=UPI001BAEB796|nr:MFS transporter [Serratia plymuthica]QUY50553.1 MFS transporter [Serratia plymuthica]